MIGRLEDFKTGWIGITLGVRIEEIDDLIASLERLKSGELDHFHLRCDDFGSPTGLADVEISLMAPDEQDNMSIDGTPGIRGE